MSVKLPLNKVFWTRYRSPDSGHRRALYALTLLDLSAPSSTPGARRSRVDIRRRHVRRCPPRRVEMTETPVSRALMSRTEDLAPRTGPLSTHHNAHAHVHALMTNDRATISDDQRPGARHPGTGTDSSGGFVLRSRSRVRILISVLESTARPRTADTRIYVRTYKARAARADLGEASTKKQGGSAGP